MNKLMALQPSEGVLAEIKSINGEIDELEGREEVYWAQRSRQDWLKDGDKNTGFFHKKADQRRHRNTIRGVFDDGGNWKDDKEEAEAVFVMYFKALFTTNGASDMNEVLDKVDVRVTNVMKCVLTAPI